jgi:opacity protein-like surface antigen
MKTRIFAIAVATIVAGAASATAQLRGGTVEINPFAGYLFGGQFGRSFNDDFDRHSRLQVDDDVAYGGRLGFNITSLFEFEAEYAQSETELVQDHHSSHHRSGGSSSDDDEDKIGDLRFQYFLGYATFNFGRGRMVPYFTVGSGAANIKTTIAGVRDTDTRYTAAIGGGLKYFFNPHFALRFDGRAYSSYLGDSEVLCSHSSDCRQSNWVTNGVANGGIILAF